VKRLLLLAVAVVALLAGCGDDDEATPTETSQARVYFLLDDQVWPVGREIPEDGDAANDIIAELVTGPDDAESSDMGLTSDFPDGVEATVANGVATVESETELTTEQLAQLVYSLTALFEPVVGSVEVDGERYTRDDFEEQTPSVLVESPLPFDAVTTPLTVSGTANTFEATFQYELLDADGNVIDENFVTATSGTGTRGTFEFVTADIDGVATLVVFEASAEDGSRMREVEIPLTVAS
jgi:germination protein M